MVISNFMLEGVVNIIDDTYFSGILCWQSLIWFFFVNENIFIYNTIYYIDSISLILKTFDQHLTTLNKLFKNLKGKKWNEIYFRYFFILKDANYFL